ncbi:MAG: hypothetical protein JKY93_07960 [Gammaproteobacteria bacterium]|nr:hypothetical protein [Gammaproteobacteria bacterium]
MYIPQRLITTILLIVIMGFHLHANAQMAPYQITKVSSGYKVTGLPAELIADFSRLPEKEAIVISLVDPSYGRSKIQGYAQIVNKTTLLMITKDSFIFHPDLNRTYLIFELKSPPMGGGSCSGCSLTNKNLKAHTPQICWCFSKLTLEQGNDSQCGTGIERLRFPTPEESALKLKTIVNEPWQTAAIYQECYPSSGAGGEDCSLFNSICQAAGGGNSSLPGGGYGCSVP